MRRASISVARRASSLGISGLTVIGRSIDISLALSLTFCWCLFFVETGITALLVGESRIGVEANGVHEKPNFWSVVSLFSYSACGAASLLTLFVISRPKFLAALLSVAVGLPHSLSLGFGLGGGIGSLFGLSYTLFFIPIAHYCCCCCGNRTKSVSSVGEGEEEDPPMAGSSTDSTDEEHRKLSVLVTSVLWAKEAFYDKGGHHYLQGRLAMEIVEISLQIFNFWVLAGLGAPQSVITLYVIVISLNILAVTLLTADDAVIAFEWSLRMDVLLDVTYAILLPVFWLSVCVISLLTGDAGMAAVQLVDVTHRLYPSSFEEAMVFAVPCVFLVVHTTGVANFAHGNDSREMKRPPRWLRWIVGIAFLAWFFFSVAVLQSMQCDQEDPLFKKCTLTAHRSIFATTGCKCKMMTVNCEWEETVGNWTGQRLLEAVLDGTKTNPEDLVSISVNGCNLTAIPVAIERATGLRYLDLNDNLLTRLPSSLWNVPIESLYVENNNLRSLPLLPANSRAAANLLYVSANHNALVRFPPSLRNVSKLTLLALSYNPFEEELPDWLGELQALTAVGFAELGLTTLPSSMARIRNLCMLNVAGNGIESIGPDFSEIMRIGSSQNCMLWLEGNPLCQGHNANIASNEQVLPPNFAAAAKRGEEEGFTMAGAGLLGAGCKRCFDVDGFTPFPTGSGYGAITACQ